MSPSVAATNAVIKNNIVNSSIYGIQIGAEGGPSTPVVTLSSVVQNNVVQAGNSAIVLFNEAGSTIQGNTVTGSGYSGIDIYYSNDNSIEANGNLQQLTHRHPVARIARQLGRRQRRFRGRPARHPARGGGPDDNTILNNFPAVQPVPAPSPSSCAESEAASFSFSAGCGG